jgi:predicted RNA binding protein YcfA (HicA-like mRNA interferase family)
MPLTTEQLTNTLDSMDLLDLGAPGPWDGDLDGHDVADIEWDQILESETRIDRRSEINQSDGQVETWERVAAEISRRSVGSRTPPPPTSVDALAWYAPIHRFGLNWGVYIYEESVFMIAGQIATYLKPGRVVDARIARQLMRMSLSVLYLHEAFHHKVESFAIRAEVARRQKIYVPYNENVYLQLINTDELMEEALACTEMYTRLREPTFRKGVSAEVFHATRSMLEDWIPTLPPGYRMGLGVLQVSTFEETRDGLLGQINDGSIDGAQRWEEWKLASHMTRALFSWKEIAYVLIPKGQTSLVPWFSKGVNPLSISSRDLEKLIRKYGYSEISGGKGSHRKYDHDTLPRIILPNSREALSPEVLRSVSRALGLGSIRDLGALV